MEYGILGPLTVAGEPFRGSPKQRTLLAGLLLARGSAVPTERLTDAIWGEHPPSSAPRALQVYVSGLRKAGLEIEHAGRGYRLRVGWLDADELERLLARALAARAAGRLEETFDTLDRALALWRGPPLPGLEGAFAHELARLEELRLRALEERADCALALGRVPDLPELQALVAEHPLRERLCSVLMLALYRAGRQAEALAVYAEARSALDELGLEPGRELQVLQGAILRHETALDVEPELFRARRHLPAPATELIGRRAEVAAVTKLIRGGTRLVTLTGPGGAGKTRVALRAAHELADAFADGVWFVGLASLVDTALVRPTIAQTLDLPEGRLLDELRERDLLLLLDNFEQLLDAAPTVGELLLAAPALRVITTSRAPLRLYGEHELGVPPLPTADAEELFLARARAAGRELPRRLVSEVCERLDGLPLAIELVAARTGELLADELLSSLDRRLELAVRGPRDLPERQRTLRAAIGWSHDLLRHEEKQLFGRLGAFAGGFTRDAARAVCGAEVESLTTLCEISLVRRGDDGRYRMLQTIREYALERLDASADADAIRLRHAEYFLARGKELVAAVAGEGVDAAYATFDIEHDNYRAALSFARDASLAELRLGLVAAVAHFWLVRGYLAEGRVWLEETLAQLGDAPIAPDLHAQALRKLATLEWRQGDLDLASRHAEEALPLLEGEVDENERYRLLILLGCIDYSRRNRDDAQDWWEQSAALARALRNEAHLSLALSNLGVVRYERREYAAAVEIYEESVAVARRAGHREYLATGLLGLGDANLRLGRFEAGRSQLVESLELFSGLGFRDRVASCCVWLAPALEHEGDHPLAARLLGIAAAIRKQTGASLDWQEQEFLDEVVERLRGAMGAARFEEALAGGEAAPDEAVRELLATVLSADPRGRPGRQCAT